MAGSAMLVTQILGRYRVQRGSMIAITNLATDDAIDVDAKALPDPSLACVSGFDRFR